MPLIQSAIKRMRQNAKRQARLRPYRTNMKTMIRKISDLVKEGNKAEAQKILSIAYKSIDMAAKKNIIHKKNAARKKSVMARMVAGVK